MVDWWVGFSVAISCFWVIIMVLSCLRLCKRKQQQRRITQVNCTVVGAGAEGYKPPSVPIQAPPYSGPSSPPPSYAASTMYPPPYSTDAAYPPASAPISSVSGAQNPVYNTGYPTGYGQPGMGPSPGGPTQPWLHTGYNPDPSLPPGSQPTYSYHHPPTAGYASGQMPGYSPQIHRP